MLTALTPSVLAICSWVRNSRQLVSRSPASKSRGAITLAVERRAAMVTEGTPRNPAQVAATRTHHMVKPRRLGHCLALIVLPLSESASALLAHACLAMGFAAHGPGQ